ncbi:GNAT family N-acetyltransferase [Cryptosporangium sp. NPDC048952]|uniref:GNAT family N-acetyltransferase n=1 Tax=Cryptosporangium sp. NPDC048952 TaxID=3363961 RepID=UPI0037147762
MTGPLSSDDMTAADMVVFRLSPPAAPEPAIDLLRRCALEVPADACFYVLVDVAAEDPHRALAAAAVTGNRLTGLAVEPGLRRQGLATRLLGDVRRTVHARGEVLELCTNADAQLTKMLRRLGFTVDTEALNSNYAHGTVGLPVHWSSRDT